MKAVIISSFLGFIIMGCNGDGKEDDSCNGNTRREVKLLLDERVGDIDTVPVFATLDSLGAISVPDVRRSTGRQDLECRTYTVTAEVKEVDRKHDGDYHILLQSGDKYLIAEVPNPNCEYAQQSVFWQNYETVYSIVKDQDLEGKVVTLTGVAFIDIDHHYSRKQADNNLELHPVLSLSY